MIPGSTTPTSGLSRPTVTTPKTTKRMFQFRAPGRRPEMREVVLPWHEDQDPERSGWAIPDKWTVYRYDEVVVRQEVYDRVDIYRDVPAANYGDPLYRGPYKEHVSSYYQLSGATPVPRAKTFAAGGGAR